MTHGPGRLLAAAFLSVSVSSAGLAGEGALPAPLTPGDRVRFAADPPAPRWTKARVVEVEGDTLVVRLHENGPATRVPIASARALEVSRGSRRRWPEGAVIGFVPGFAFGAYAGHVLGCDDQGPGCTAWPATLAAGAVLGASTAAVGALVGLLFKKERWEPVAFDPSAQEGRFRPERSTTLPSR